MRSYLRRLAIRTFRYGAKRLGPDFREELIRELIPGTRPARLVGDLARESGFVGLAAAGDSGFITGSLDDDAALFKYAREHRWSPRQQQLFADLFRARGGTYVDIGANIGLTVIPIARIEGVCCHAFEPAPENVEHLRRNVRLNGVDGNVRVHHAAVFDRDTELTFELASRHSGDHRIRIGAVAGQLQEEQRPTIRVAAKRLDDVITEIRTPLGVKIDTQGAEPFVIRGGTRALALADLVALEFWPYSMARMGGDVGSLIDFCQEHFREGSATPGDTDDPPSWRPISTLANDLGRYAAESVDNANHYLDVLLRK